VAPRFVEHLEKLINPSGAPPETLHLPELREVRSAPDRT